MYRLRFGLEMVGGSISISLPADNVNERSVKISRYRQSLRSVNEGLRWLLWTKVISHSDDTCEDTCACCLPLIIGETRADQKTISDNTTA